MLGPVIVVRALLHLAVFTVALSPGAGFHCHACHDDGGRSGCHADEAPDGESADAIPHGHEGDCRVQGKSDLRASGGARLDRAEEGAPAPFSPLFRIDRPARRATASATSVAPPPRPAQSPARLL